MNLHFYKHLHKPEVVALTLKLLILRPNYKVFGKIEDFHL